MAPKTGPNRVLIVEDSRAMRAFVRAVLEESDEAEEVVEAESGFEAFRILARDAFALVIADVNMPDINGLEVVRFVRSSDQHRSTPILLISSEASAEDQERGLRLGANAFLTKPFTADGLVDAIRDLRE